MNEVSIFWSNHGPSDHSKGAHKEYIEKVVDVKKKI
jgi:hypothetical protein